MSELVVIGFDTVEEADAVLLKLDQLQTEYLVDLEDAVVVVRDENGKIQLKQKIQSASNWCQFRSTFRCDLGWSSRLAVP